MTKLELMHSVRDSYKSHLAQSIYLSFFLAQLAKFVDDEVWEHASSIAKAEADKFTSFI